jgi:putative addiction module component (TIGR02574 family)
MARSVQELLREASQLSENDRAELAGRLLETIEGPPDPDVEKAWAEEIERRIRELDEGKVKTIPWQQVRAELFSRTRERG